MKTHFTAKQCLSHLALVEQNAAEQAASALSAMKSSLEYSYRQKLFLV